MYFDKNVTSWLNVIDDGNAMVARLKIIEHLLLNCACDLPLSGSKCADGTNEGYNGHEMLFFLDEIPSMETTQHLN